MPNKTGGHALVVLGVSLLVHAAYAVTQYKQMVTDMSPEQITAAWSNLGTLGTVQAQLLRLLNLNVPLDVVVEVLTSVALVLAGLLTAAPDFRAAQVRVLHLLSFSILSSPRYLIISIQQHQRSYMGPHHRFNTFVS